MIRKSSAGSGSSDQILREIEILLSRKPAGGRLSRVASQTVRDLAVKGLAAGVDVEVMARAAQVTGHSVRNWRRMSENKHLIAPQAIELRVTPHSENDPEKVSSPMGRIVGKKLIETNPDSSKGVIKVHLKDGICLEGPVSVFSPQYLCQIINGMSRGLE